MVPLGLIRADRNRITAMQQRHRALVRISALCMGAYGIVQVLIHAMPRVRANNAHVGLLWRVQACAYSAICHSREGGNLGYIYLKFSLV